MSRKLLAPVPVGADLAGGLPSPTLANPLAALVAGFNRTGVVSGATTSQLLPPALAFVAQVAADISGSGTSSLTIPSSVAVGDLMLFVVGQESAANGGSCTTPSGWTLVDTATGSGSQGQQTFVFSKVAVSGDTGGSATVGATYGSLGVKALVVYRGVSTTTPVNVEAKQGSGSAGTAMTAPSVTTTAAGCLIVSIFATHDSGTSITATPATNRVNYTRSSGFAAVAVSDFVQSAAGASTAQTATCTSSSWTGITVALSPQSATPNMSVSITAGTALVNGSTVAVAATNPSIAAADSTNPRLDLVTVDSSGAVAVVTGTAAPVPSYPAVPANKAVLGLVAVAAGATSVLNANITDLRLMMPAPLVDAQSASAPAVTTNGTITTANVGLARVSPTGAVTGVILQAGTIGGQRVTVVNEAAAANTVTMAASGTSNVANGSACVIVGLTAQSFVWDAATSLWYPS